MLVVRNSAGCFTNVWSMAGPTFDKQTFSKYPVDKNMSTPGGLSGPTYLPL